MTVSELPSASQTWRSRLLEKWFTLRNRLLSSAQFQRWAAGFPVTRPTAEARARDLFDLVSGFVYSQILAACVDVDLFHILKPGPLTLDELAVRCNLPIDGARCLLEAAVTLELVARRGEQAYGLGQLGAAFLGNPGLAEMVRHHRLFYADMGDPVALLRNRHKPSHLQQFWAYARASDPAALIEPDISDYTRLMSQSQGFVATDILEAVPLRNAHILMDVGGGDGSFLISAARQWSHLQVLLADLPAVADRAQKRFDSSGLKARARATGVDFLNAALPTGADVISLVRVLHDHDDDAVEVILARVFKALPPGGTVIIAEPMADTKGAERVGAAYFNFYLRAMGSGRSRTSFELQSYLKSSGFSQIQPIKTRRPLLTSVIVAVRS